MKKIICISSFFLAYILCFNHISAQQNVSQDDDDKLIVGTWVHKTDRTIDGREYIEFTCHDTIQYKKNGLYVFKQCNWNEAGNWKFNADKNVIIHYNISCAYWEKLLGTKDLGESHGEVISLSQTELVTVIYAEGTGEIRQYYTKLE
ncbi:MAG: hypothetical protein ACI9Y7_001981 [Dokdonia sp.]|jgi:hypothetical protein